VTFVPKKRPVSSNELDVLFDQTREAYHAYLMDGRTFSHAQILFDLNQALKETLIRIEASLPPELTADAAALLRHYDAWSRAWLDTANASAPGPEDVFKFENDVTFPKDSEIRIRAYWHASPVDFAEPK
jgi:hypothetical protein